MIKKYTWVCANCLLPVPCYFFLLTDGKFGRPDGPISCPYNTKAADWIAIEGVNNADN